MGKQTTTRKCPKVEKSLSLPGSPTLKELPLNKNIEPKIEIITSVDDHSPLRNISLPNNFINHKLSLLFTLHFTKYQIISNKHQQNNVNYYTKEHSCNCKSFSNSSLFAPILENIFFIFKHSINKRLMEQMIPVLCLV